MKVTGQEHIKHLDGLRGVAILLVLISHFTNDTFLEKYFKLGWTGVDLFFVLSGFLITGILLDTKQQKGYYRVFITRRVLRIFPLYYGILVFCFFLSPYFSIIHWFRNYHFYFWTYTQNYLIAQKGFFTVPLGHFWSLAIEEQFYLFWPLVVFLLNKKQLMVTLLILMISGIIIRSYHPVFPFASVFTPAHMDGLLTGAFVALMIRINQTTLLKMSPYFLAFFSITLSLFLLTQKPWNYYTHTFIKFGYTLIALFFASTLAFSFFNIRFQKILSLKVMRWFGKYSYGIYVYHAIIINIAKYYYPTQIHDHRIAWYLILFLLTLSTSYISYHLLEKYFLKMKPSFTVAGAG